MLAIIDILVNKLLQFTIAEQLQAMEEQVYVFVDDSNLWIEGQKYKARELKLQGTEHDPRYRVDLGKFLDLVVGNRSVVEAHLYGSKPPPNDSVWKAARERNYVVKVFDRAGGIPRGREKEVDMAMGVDITKAACKCEQDHKDDTTFIIVTGDRDFKSPVEGVMEEGVKVELWGWKHGISIQYRKLANESSLFTLNTLDDIASEFSFTAYKSTREACDIDAAQAIVFKDIPNNNISLDSLASYLLCLKRLFYTTSLPHDDDKQYQDVIVEFPNSKPDVVLKQIEAVKLPCKKPISHPTYVSEKRQKNQLVPPIELKNRYESLGDVDDNTTVEAFQGSLGVNIEAPEQLHVHLLVTPDITENEACKTNDAECDDWIAHTNNRAGSYTRRQRNHQTRCRWEIHCAKGANCSYRHTSEEEKLFKMYPNTKFRNWKTKLCKNSRKHKKEECPYAHEESDSWCLKCQSWGHPTDNCKG